MVSVLDSGAGVKEVYYGICASREYANHVRSEQDPLSHFKRLQMEIFVFLWKETGTKIVATVAT